MFGKAVRRLGDTGFVGQSKCKTIVFYYLVSSNDDKIHGLTKDEYGSAMDKFGETQTGSILKSLAAKLVLILVFS